MNFETLIGVVKEVKMKGAKVEVYRFQVVIKDEMSSAMVNGFVKRVKRLF